MKATVAKFRVAATSRRYDKERGRWVDGASLRVRVNCWRRLAENVAACVTAGDPLVVTGRIYTRDWVGDDGQHRVSYEMDAVAVGHDLARGQSRFERNRNLVTATTAGDSPESAAPPDDRNLERFRQSVQEAPDSGTVTEDGPLADAAREADDEADCWVPAPIPA